jgi:hypothetical protein
MSTSKKLGISKAKIKELLNENNFRKNPISNEKIVENYIAKKIGYYDQMQLDARKILEECEE